MSKSLASTGKRQTQENNAKSLGVEDSLRNRRAAQEYKDLEPDLFSVCAKIARRDSNWTQAEVEDALLWVKCLVAILLGIAWGFFMQGGPALIGAVMVIASFTSAFMKGWLGLDEDEYGGALLMFEGLYPAGATFLVTWTLTYTILNGGNFELGDLQPQGAEGA